MEDFTNTYIYTSPQIEAIVDSRLIIILSSAVLVEIEVIVDSRLIIILSRAFLVG